MPVYKYDKSRISKKTKKRVTETWYYYAGKYTDPVTGKRKSYKKRGFEREKEAREAEHLYLISLKNKPTTATITFKELATLYLQYQLRRRKTSTVITIMTHLDKHIYEYIGDKQIDKITTHDIINFQNLKSDEGYSVSYINDMYSTIKKILYYGVKHYGLSANVCTKVDKLKDPEEDAPKPMICWQGDDFERFIQEADDLQYMTLYTLLYYTGLRRGEALALTWEDVDFDKSTVWIHHTMTNKLTADDRKRGMKYKITSPKTKRSFRRLSIPKSVVQLLQEWKDEASMIDGFNNSSFVFGIIRPLPYSTVSRKLKQWAHKAGVAELHPHGLRHSHISFLINNGVNILAVAERAGDTVEMILKVYAHLFKNKEEEIISILEDDCKCIPKVSQK